MPRTQKQKRLFKNIDFGSGVEATRGMEVTMVIGGMFDLCARD